jgi:hypothetical protein
VALSPDGTQIAFVANRARVPIVWIRTLDSVENKALPGTENASFPFWAPDGRHLGFFADGKLKRIEIAGGRPLVVTDAANGRGATWNAAGVILFSPGVSHPIMQVSANGGRAAALTEVNTGGTGPDHRWPQFLPDGRRFIFSSTLGRPETKGIFIGSLDKTPYVRIVNSDAAGRYAAPDRLLTTMQGALRAYRFDPSSGTVTGDPEIIAQGFVGAVGGMTASDTGLLAYRTGTTQRRQLTWVDRTGCARSASPRSMMSDRPS